jgi:hypothetical protein
MSSSASTSPEQLINDLFLSLAHKARDLQLTEAEVTKFIFPPGQISGWIPTSEEIRGHGGKKTGKMCRRC